MLKYCFVLYSFCTEVQGNNTNGTLGPMRVISPWVIPQHWELSVLPFATSGWVLLHPTDVVDIEELCCRAYGL